MTLVRRAYEEHREAMEAWAPLLERSLPAVVDGLCGCMEAGGKVLICGNGGSAADAQHLAAELVCRFEKDGRALPAVALTVDSSALTALGNDLGFDHVFSRQVQALGRPGDILVGISTSGSSANVLRAVDAARGAGMQVLALTGQPGQPLHSRADWSLQAPTGRTARVQELHEFAIHCLCGMVEQRLR